MRACHGKVVTIKAVALALACLAGFHSLPKEVLGADVTGVYKSNKRRLLHTARGLHSAQSV